MFCPKCGRRNDDQARFCQACGANLQTIPVEPNVQQIVVTSSAVAYAGFWRRFAAYVIDYILILILILFVVIIVASIFDFMGFMVGMAGGGESGGEAVGFGIVLVIFWLYWAVMESSSKQATLGKMALGIIVTDLEGNRISFGRATERYLAKIISGFILIGFIMVGFTARKQGLHDIIAGCVVVKK